MNKRKKTLFFKIMTMSVGVLLVALIIGGIVLYSLMTKTLTESKTNEMKKALNEISVFTMDYLSSYEPADNGKLSFDNEWGENSDSLFSNIMGKLESSYGISDILTFTVNDNGKICYAFPTLPGKPNPYCHSDDEMDKDIVRNLNYYDDFYYMPDLKQYQKTLDNIGIYENSSDVYDIFGSMPDKYLTVSKTLNYYNKNSSEWECAGAVILALPAPELTAARNRFIFLYAISALISILIDVVCVYIFAKKITGPIKELDKAAKKLAGGNFDETISRKTNDELGDLIDSFNQMTVSLSRMDAVKTEFISNVSHELRTPITSVKGFIEAILDGVIPEDKYDHYLGLCKSEVDRMNNLINELLDMTRIEFAKSNMFEVFDINALITEHLLKMEPQISGKNIDVDLNFEKESQLVSAGKASISRVIINLVHNATKFTPEGGNITISVKENGQKVEVSVADNGIGIPEDEVGRVFERFYKSDKSRGMDKTGTGLGLAIVKKIMESHNETIECQSKLGEGTTFIFTLASAEYKE